MAIFIVRFVIYFHYSCIGNIQINTLDSLLYLFSRCDIWNLEPIEIYIFYYYFGDFICVTSVRNSVMIVFGICYAVLQAKRTFFVYSLL